MTRSNTSSAQDVLEKLGFTALESLTYIALLENSPATAYQVAKRTGKAVANTYKAIASLSAKGAVILDEGQKQLCRAVEVEELLSKLQLQQKLLAAQAADLLKGIAQPSSDTRVYQLADVDAVYARARAMLKRAKKLVLAEAFPVPLAKLGPDFSAAGERKVRVAIQCFAGEKLKGALSVMFSRAKEILESEPGQLLTLVVDRREVLIALLSHDDTKVLQALHTSSSFIASVIYAYLATELQTSWVFQDESILKAFRTRAAEIREHLDPGEGPLILYDNVQTSQPAEPASQTPRRRLDGKSVRKKH